LADLRGQAQAWTHIALDVNSPDRLSEALLEVTRTQWVSVDDARALGFWDDDNLEDNPPRDDEGRVEVPAWRHAIINYPHPLLKRGLVVLDTPGLNAIGAEPELTLSLLPSAHAAVFILGADTGVTKSDLTIWRDHLGSPGSSAYVVLNKIDALADPLSTPEQVREQIAQQQEATARTLGTTVDRVFPLSARQALAARIDNDAPALLQSRLPDLEQALSAQMLPRCPRRCCRSVATCSSKACSTRCRAWSRRSRVASATCAASSPSRPSNCAACAARAARRRA
jgi:hypothetical protein